MYKQDAGEIHSRAWIPQFMNTKGFNSFLSVLIWSGIETKKLHSYTANDVAVCYRSGA